MLGLRVEEGKQRGFRSSLCCSSCARVARISMGNAVIYDLRYIVTAETSLGYGRGSSATSVAAL